MRGLIVSAFMLLGCIQAFGQESRKEVCIGFPVGNSTLDTAYGDNAMRLSEVEAQQREIIKTVRRLAEEGQVVLGGGADDALV